VFQQSTAQHGESERPLGQPHFRSSMSVSDHRPRDPAQAASTGRTWWLDGRDDGDDRAMTSRSDR
jgi:hypothetical protein